jgi:hypothetical protein
LQRRSITGLLSTRYTVERIYETAFLSQQDAQNYMDMDKQVVENISHQFPSIGEKTVIPLMSMDESERFVLDINRGRRKAFKCSYQERHGGNTVLVRLDLNPRRHRNPPDLFPPPGFEQYRDMIFDTAHLHIYVEGYDTKWAIPAESEGFNDPTSISEMTETFRKFCIYCNVVIPPTIQEPLI